MKHGICWSNFYFIKVSSDRFSYFTLYHTPNLLIHPSLPSSLHTSSGIFKVHMPSIQLTWKYLSLGIFYFQVSESHFLYLIWNYYVILLFQVKITFLINITCFLPKPHTIFSFFRLSILINPHQNFRSQWKFIPSVFEDWFSVAFYFYTHRSISVLIYIENQERKLMFCLLWFPWLPYLSSSRGSSCKTMTLPQRIFS